MKERTSMQLGMIGLGRMGANMVRRLLQNGHQCIVYDRSAEAVKELVKEKAVGAASEGDFVQKLSKPRADVDVGTSGGVWGLERGYCMMMPTD
jgi:6-phosphogluconate dehydrogenase (decarboxylating)